MPAYLELFERNLNPVFIETGSYTGDGIQLALDAGFDLVISIELSHNLWQYCRDRFANKMNVVCLHGDSSKVLPDAIRGIGCPITFWLDAHYSEGVTVRGDRESPLLEELEIISKHNLKNHTIMIDDLRCWNLKDHGFDKDILMERIRNINPGYLFMFEDGRDNNLRIYRNDILVARCPQ